MIERLVARCFRSRDAAHLAHWKTVSYAQHMALGSFYDEVIDQIDGIVEAYQGGKRTLVDVAFDAPRPTIDILTHLEMEARWIAENRVAIADGLIAVDNMLQDLIGLYNSTCYKLRFLK